MIDWGSLFIGAAISFPFGIAASVIAWWLISRGLPPRLSLSPKITRKPPGAESSGPNPYRFKIKNICKRTAVDLSYSARLRFQKTGGQLGNWVSLPIPLGSTGRATLSSNVLVTIKSYAMSEQNRTYLSSPIDDEQLDIHQLLNNLTDARLHITCFATDSYSGARKELSQEYLAADVVDGLYRPVNPLGPWRTWFNVRIKKQVHPELEILSRAEVDEVMGRRDSSED